MSSPKPKYDLLQIKKLIRDSSCIQITNVAFKGAVELGYMDEDAIISVLEDLEDDNFYKTRGCSVNCVNLSDTLNRQVQF
jgi:hypothetical protein